MKLIFAIVNSDDSNMVQEGLTKGGFSATKMASTGGFLMAGNTTFIIGVEDSDVEDCIAVIKRYSSQRTQVVPTAGDYNTGVYGAYPMEVKVGGATVFVMPVERFEKV